MKTSVMEVHNMLSVLSVDEVETRIGKVAGVESVTVNFAAGSATVRYDETRLDVADIKSSVRQGAYEAAAPNGALPDDSHENPSATTTPPATPKTHVVAPATTVGASTVAAQPDKAMPDAMPSMTPKSSPDAAPTPTSSAQKPAPEADAPAPTDTAPASDEPQGKDKD